MALITGRILSPDVDPMETAVLSIRRVDEKPIGGIVPTGTATITLNSNAEFLIALGKGRYLFTVVDTADVLDVTVPADTGTFVVSDILTNPNPSSSIPVGTDNFTSFDITTDPL